MRRSIILVSAILVMLMFLVGCARYEVPYQDPETELGDEAPLEEPMDVEEPEFEVEADETAPMEVEEKKPVKKGVKKVVEEPEVEAEEEPEAMVEEEEAEEEPEAMVEEEEVEPFSEKIWKPVGGELSELNKITVTEGELVKLNVQATDPDGDDLEYEFSAPLDNDGEWLTEIGDAGEYTVTVSVSDGLAETSQQVNVVVMHKNKPPVVEVLSEVTINEGETISLKPEITDPEGDDVEVTYSGWMTTSIKKVGYDEAGEHEVLIEATDGTHTVSETVVVIVEDMNRAPELEIEF